MRIPELTVAIIRKPNGILRANVVQVFADGEHQGRNLLSRRSFTRMDRAKEYLLRGFRSDRSLLSYVDRVIWELRDSESNLANSDIVNFAPGSPSSGQDQNHSGPTGNAL